MLTILILKNRLFDKKHQRTIFWIFIFFYHIFTFYSRCLINNLQMKTNSKIYHTLESFEFCFNFQKTIFHKNISYFEFDFNFNVIFQYDMIIINVKFFSWFDDKISFYCFFFYQINRFNFNRDFIFNHFFFDKTSLRSTINDFWNFLCKTTNCEFRIE